MRDVLKGTGHLPPGGVECREAVRSRADAVSLTADTDLVIDCTGSGPATVLLCDAATHSSASALSVYLHRDGGIIRVDRWPVAEDETRLPEVPPPPGEQAPRLREGGCGDPVSPAPPHAAATAAAAAVRAATDLLTGRPVPASTVEVLQAQPDAPYDRQCVIQ